MTTATMSGPNTESAAPTQNAVPSLDAIATKMAAMRNQVVQESKPTETGEAKAAPVAPQGTTVDNNVDGNTESIEPEIDSNEDADTALGNEEDVAPEEVSNSDSSSEDIIDFLDFADTNPNAKFKFMRNGKEVIVDAKKAAAILGQGGAIHEDARQLKIQQAEFENYVKHKTGETEGLLLAMEFTVRPQLQRAYDEIVKTQNYQNTFKQQLTQTQDPAQHARIQSAMQQNEQYIASQAATIKQIKPNVDQFYSMRQQQVQTILQQSRAQFTDKELKNDYVYNELRERLGKGWKAKDAQLVPGVANIDLVSSDEHLMSLVRDGLKYREKPKVKSAGNSIAALTGKRTGGAATAGRGNDNNIAQLRERAQSGDKKAGENLLTARLSQIRSARAGR